MYDIVEYLTCVSITSSALPSLTCMAGQTSRVLLAYIIPWINKNSLALYIACMQYACHD